jgi:hypothetical protein
VISHVLDADRGWVAAFVWGKGADAIARHLVEDGKRMHGSGRTSLILGLDRGLSQSLKAEDYMITIRRKEPRKILT